MIRGLAVVGIVGALFFVGVQAAEAATRTVDIAFASRSDVRSACVRVGGSPYGIEDEEADYGCYSAQAVVSCIADGSACQAAVDDTRPITGNSLHYILGFGGPASAARTIGPLDAHVTPGYSAQTGAYAPIQPITGSTMLPWSPPFTNPYAKKPY